MKTLTASMILSVMFLSAGAFAGSNHPHNPQAATLSVDTQNVTVISKNQVWPLPGHISVEPCNISRCIGI